MKLDIAGLVGATFTPFNPSGELNLDAVELHAQRLVDQGIVGAFINGTTGEGQSLSSEERRLLTQRWCDVAGKKLTIIAHVGHASFVEAKLLAEHAAKAGVAGIAAMPPYFFKPTTVDDVLACLVPIAAAAPNLPFYYYHFPVMSGVLVSPSEILRTGMKRIPNLAGLKFTDDNLLEYERCVDVAGGTMDLMLGREGMMLPALAAGGRAWIGSSLNFMAALFHAVQRNFREGNLAAAREAQRKANAMLAVLARFGGMRAMKAAMMLQGLDVGPSRAPLRTFEEREFASLRAELEPLGFFDIKRLAESASH
jgi:N-acetylneuraminate lyase